MRKNALPPPPAAEEPLWPSLEVRDRQRERRRKALLDAAVTMFNERGFQATSLDDIAAQVGITKPVIYHYLGNKDQVLFHCVQHGIELLRDAAASSPSGEGSGADQLRLFLIAYAEIIMSDFGRCVIRTDDHQLSADSRTRFRALKREIDQALRDRVRTAMADGTIRQGDVRLTAFTLAGSLNWLAKWHDPSGPDSARDIAETVVETLLGGIRATG
jgi:AcrR family transcriptional regulator